MALPRHFGICTRLLSPLTSSLPPLTSPLAGHQSSFSTLPPSTSISPSRTKLVKDLPLLALPSSRQYSSSVPTSLWKLGRLNHIAIAVPDLEKATAFYRDALRATVSAPQELPEHGVTTVFVELENTKLELLHPLGEKSPIEKFLEKNKAGGLHHICIEVNDILAAMKDVSKAGIRCLGKEPKIGAHGKPVIFLHPADCNGVLTELEEA